MALMGSLSFATIVCVILWWRARWTSAERQVQLMLGLDVPEQRSLPASAMKRLRQSGWIHRLEEEARRAGVRLSAAQILGLSIIIGLLGAGLAQSLLPGRFTPLLGVVIGLFVPRLWLVRAKRRRAEAFNQALSGIVSRMASSLRAGGSLEQALLRVARPDGQPSAHVLPEPARSEFEQAAREVGLGATPVEVLSGMYRRVESRELDLVNGAIAILVRTGGDMADVLQKLGDQMEESRLARAEVVATTTQIRMTAYVVTLAPAILILLLNIFNPTYFLPMLHSGTGQMVFFGCISSVGVAWLWIRRMLQVEVD